MKIITTVGTSLLSNWGGQYDSILEKKDYDMNIFDNNDGEGLGKKTRKLIGDLASFAREKESISSAEIASINKIDPKNEGEIYLVCTETNLSRVCAEALKIYYKEHVKTIKVIPGLQISNLKQFERKGLVELFDELEKISNGYWKNICFNMTGGYKAVIPFLTIVAQIYKVPIYYIYKEEEGGNYELLKMPITPIDVNWSEFEKYRFVWDDLRTGIKGWANYQIKHQLSDDFHSCVWIDDADPDYALISGLGEAFFKRFTQWTFIYVLQNGPFSVNHTRRKALNDAISKLQEKLNYFIHANNLSEKNRDQIVEQIRKHGGELDHTEVLKGTEVLISKYPSSNPEIRLLYSFSIDFGKITHLKIWDFRIETFNHGTYPKEFKEFYEANKNSRWIPYLQTQNF